MRKPKPCDHCSSPIAQSTQLIIQHGKIRLSPICDKCIKSGTNEKRKNIEDD